MLYSVDGTSYTATATIFPVYDFSSVNDSLVLRHFAAILSEVVDIQPGAGSSAKKICIAPSCLESYDITSEISDIDFFTSTPTSHMRDLLALSVKCRNAIVLTDHMGRIVHINKGFQELYGYSLIEVQGRVINDIVCKKAPSKDFFSVLLKSFKGCQYSSHHQAKYGLSFFCTMNLVPVNGNSKLSGKLTKFSIFSIMLSQLIVFAPQLFIRSHSFLCPFTAVDIFYPNCDS
jgi:PAS domain S-box-containing protein